ncbi:MAG: hypothetical protein ACLSB9_22570, partial [Hydrogeniiclostridium mannosilyticum]
MRKESHEVRTIRHLPYSRSFKRQHYRLSPIGDYNLPCFPEIATLASSTVLIAVLLAFTNYLPIVQRQIYQKSSVQNYAAQFLMPDDETINPASKKRYYRILTEIDQSFSGFQHPDTSKSFYQCCESAVRYLREKTRANSLILEENINYGFYRTLYSNKTTGIILCIVFGCLTAAYSLFSSESLSQIPISNY